MWILRHTFSQLPHLVAWTSSSFSVQSSNVSKTFLDFQSYLEYHCRCYCCCYWYYHYSHHWLLLFGCCYWLYFFFGRILNLVVSHDSYGNFLHRCYSLHFLQCSHCWFADMLMMQIYFDFHPWHVVTTGICFLFLLDIRRFKRIKRNIWKTFLLTLNFAPVTNKFICVFYEVDELIDDWAQVQRGLYTDVEKKQKKDNVSKGDILSSQTLKRIIGAVI